MTGAAPTCADAMAASAAIKVSLYQRVSTERQARERPFDSRLMALHRTSLHFANVSRRSGTGITAWLDIAERARRPAMSVAGIQEPKC